MSYSQLIQFSLLAAQDSIQAAIASEAHVSTLRVVDIFLSSASQAAGVDVWFVLLQKPKLDSGQATPLGASKRNYLINKVSLLVLIVGIPFMLYISYFIIPTNHILARFNNEILDSYFLFTTNLVLGVGEVFIIVIAGKEPDLDNSFDRLLATFESNYQV